MSSQTSLVLEKKISLFELTESAANTRARFMSRHSEIMPGNFENIEIEESENAIIRSTKTDSIFQKSADINLRDHSAYSKNDSNNSSIMRVRTLNEFIKIVNHETDESR
jgi:hypothetical protein